MNQKQIEMFQNQNIKLVFTNDFILIGKIEEIFEDSILFKTKHKKSLIRFDFIKQITGE